MKFFLLIFLFFIFVTSKPEKLKVEIFIESECKNSKKFIQDQIWKFYDEFKEKIDFDFVIFGKSKSFIKNSQIEFKCQHGPAECHNNMIMSCALNSIHDKNLQMKFIACSMGYEKTKIHCAEEIGISKEKLRKCLSDGEGIELQLEAEKRTKKIVGKNGKIPSIVFDGKFDLSESFKSVVNFRKIVKGKI